MMRPSQRPRPLRCDQAGMLVFELSHQVSAEADVAEHNTLQHNAERDR